MPRPQFSLKSLLWLMACVGCFFGGSAWQRHKRDLEMARLQKFLRAEQDEKASLRDLMEAERRPLRSYWPHE